MLKELKINTPGQMGPYLCSKWIHHYFLIDIKELKDLFAIFDTNYIFPIGRVLKKHNLDSVAEFIDAYDNVVELLKKNVVNLSLLKEKLPLAISKSLDAFYLHIPNEKAQIVKVTKPVLQLQLNSFRYCSLDQIIRLNSLGDDSVFWGLKLSYPQIFQDPQSNEIFKIDASFANFSYFSLIRKWLRANTNPVRFIIDQKKIATQLRIGKKCLSWIHLHPQLKQLNCEIDYYAN